MKPGDIFAYWPQKKIAAELGCSVRTIKRGVRSLRQAGVITVRQRVRPYGASCVFVRPGPSGVPSGVPSHREPRTEPRKEKYVRTVGKPTTFPSKRADTGQQTKQQRLVAAVCWKLGFWPSAARLEEFDESENTEKQAFIKRLLRVEARHDRRVSGVRSVTGENKTASPISYAVLAPGTNVPPAAKKPKKTKGKAKTAGTNVPPATNVAPTAKTPNETGGQKTSTATNVAPRPDPPPMTPELRAEIEAVERGRGWHRVAGTWMKLS